MNTTDAIIIGAGMAGLSAALELKKRGASFVILEAADEAGGRAITRRLPSGVDADLGAHWMHGEKNPLADQLKHYGIHGHKSDKGRMFVCEHGRKEEVGSDWLDKAIDKDLARWIKTRREPDQPIAALGRDDKARDTLRTFGRLWNCVDPPIQPSAREFLTDESTPGGLQVPGGMVALTSKMVEDIGAENLRLNTPVTTVSSGRHGAKAEVRGGEAWTADTVFFTGSLGVLDSGIMSFDPPLSVAFKNHLGGLVMGRMDKIILEVDDRFFKERGIAPDTGYELLDGPRPHFAHLHGAGAPLITLFITGAAAETVERMDAKLALDYAHAALSPIAEIYGWADRLVSPPLVTGWSSNPYTRGAYSSRLPGARRSGPWLEGHICFCGDTFSEHFPASMAGAFLSGRDAAQMLFH